MTGASGGTVSALERLLEEQPLHPLLVVEDVVPLKELPDGYILTFSAGLKMNGQQHDVAALYVKEPVQIDDFYCLPYHTVLLHQGAFDHAAREMLNAGYPRQLIRLPHQEYPSLIDAVSLGEGKAELSSHAYRNTSFQHLGKEGESGQQVIEQVRRIVEEARERIGGV